MKSVAGLRCRPHTLSGFFHFKEELFVTVWNEAHPEQPYRNLYYEQPDEGSNVDSGIPTDKDQYSELDVQDQKEISDFQRQVDGRLDMLMLGSPTTYAKG